MNTFILISGWLFWILAMAVAVLVLGAILLDRWIAFENKQNASIQIDATRKMGTNIFSPAHWLHDDEYRLPAAPCIFGLTPRNCT